MTINSNLFNVSSSTLSTLASTVCEEKIIAREELNNRRAPQTPEMLERTFAGLSMYLDEIIVTKFVSAGIVDGFQYLTKEGVSTNDAELGEQTNPNFMKVVADGRRAWKALELINFELFQLTNSIWNSKEKTGSLTLLGFNDNSNGAAYINKKFTVTEAGALATLLFGRKENRATGLFFRNFIVQQITNDHEKYMKSPLCQKRMEAARARTVQQSNFVQFQTVENAQSQELSNPVIPQDSGLKVDKNGRLRKHGKFVGKNNSIV